MIPIPILIVFYAQVVKGGLHRFPPCYSDHESMYKLFIIALFSGYIPLELTDFISCHLKLASESVFLWEIMKDY